MAKEKGMVVIKKITIAGGGGHGGAWKVAFADFMTAMMAFFLVMWLLNTQSAPVKKNVSDYFSTPSVIEYNFSNFGAELTLEKLFLDLVTEPLKTLQGFITPVDHMPNLMNMGMKKVVMSYMADQLGELAEDVEISQDSLSFKIPDYRMFEKGTAFPISGYVTILEKLKNVIAGLEDSDLEITSVVFHQSIPGTDGNLTKKVASERLELIEKRIQAFMEHPTVSIRSRSVAANDKRDRPNMFPDGGYIKFEIRQKEVLADGKKPRPLRDDIFGNNKDEASGYNDFVKKLTKNKKKSDSKKQ